MIDWGFAWKVFFVSILGTFIASGILTVLIRLTGIFITNYFPDDPNLEE